MGLQTAKPVASLSAGLLARKGAARPGQKYMAEPGLEIPENHRVIRFGTPEVDESVPAPDFHEPFADNDLQVAELSADVSAVAVAEVQPAVFTTHIETVRVEASREHKPRRAAGSRSKAAFTLRLDAERHLRLRLLSAHQHRSAQRIVLDAVDRLLAETFEPLLASGRLVASVAKEQVA